MDIQSWAIQVQWLFTLALPVACISWTVTHEEVLREPRDYCVKCSKESRSIFRRKFFYLFTCEYCFSHYVSLGILLLTGYKLLFNDWRGYLIAGFSLVWMANVYIAVFSLLRYGIKKEKIDISIKEQQIEESNNQ